MTANYRVRRKATVNVRTDATVVIGDLPFANPISRLGYLNYGVIGETFRLRLPPGIREQRQS